MPIGGQGQVICMPVLTLHVKSKQNKTSTSISHLGSIALWAIKMIESDAFKLL